MAFVLGNTPQNPSRRARRSGTKRAAKARTKGVAKADGVHFGWEAEAHAEGDHAGDGVGGSGQPGGEQPEKVAVEPYEYSGLQFFTGSAPLKCAPP